MFIKNTHKGAIEFILYNIINPFHDISLIELPTTVTTVISQGSQNFFGWGAHLES